MAQAEEELRQAKSRCRDTTEGGLAQGEGSRRPTQEGRADAYRRSRDVLIMISVVSADLLPVC